TNLSDPIHPYHGEQNARKGKRFVTDGPLYIRVFGQHSDGTVDRTFTGAYAIQFQRAMGRTPDDSIALEAAKTNDYEWVDVVPEQLSVWFDVTVNQVGSRYGDNSLVNASFVAGSPLDWHDYDVELWKLVGVDEANMNNFVKAKVSKPRKYRDPLLHNAVN